MDEALSALSNISACSWRSCGGFSRSGAQGRGLLALEPKAALLAGSLGAAAGFGGFRLGRLRAASRDAPLHFFCTLSTPLTKYYFSPLLFALSFLFSHSASHRPAPE